MATEASTGRSLAQLPPHSGEVAIEVEHPLLAHVKGRRLVHRGADGHLRAAVPPWPTPQRGKRPQRPGRRRWPPARRAQWPHRPVPLPLARSAAPRPSLPRPASHEGTLRGRPSRDTRNRRPKGLRATLRRARARSSPWGPRRAPSAAREGLPGLEGARQQHAGEGLDGSVVSHHAVVVGLAHVAESCPRCRPAAPAAAGSFPLAFSSG